jgi:LmbE family N-acetylglucosaminyl deacetylase
MCSSEGQPVYLSPHLDDAVLSCGGLLARHVHDGLQPLVVTCCAGLPDDQPLSPFAARQHRGWGEPEDPVSLRRREDAAALTDLGVEYQHWNYLDCIYRRQPGSGRFLYASERALFGRVDPTDRTLIRQLVDECRARFHEAATMLYAPLAVGQHVDHQIVFRAALELRRVGFAARFFEDYPYARDRRKISQALRAWVQPPSPTLQPLTEHELAAKISAIGRYRSQLIVLFGSEPAMVRQVRAYALAVGGGHEYGERYWQEGEHAGADS